ncbi:MAG: CO dehydrogenase/acetyl-CoA synthase subunit delta [Candidatus Omnitrophota bacterium]|nr:CO dehydrogenase/acetyl-CoA synthase subunit delta [Candidatus Omnitrophota bacterium]
MALELIKENWSNSVNVTQIGATKEEGGTRSKAIKVGGQSTLPFLFAEGDIPYRPVIAMEVWDVLPEDWPEALKEPFSGCLGDPSQWAQKCVKEYKADLICLRLQGVHPDGNNKSPEDAAKVVSTVLKAIDVPLIILGCGDDSKDNLVLPACCEAAKGERCLIGEAVQDNYKTLTAAALADGHNIIATSPIDINIAKQSNILISDMGIHADRIVINPTIGALGYGLEYAYSIMERARLAALSGDKMLSMPFICFVGYEAWRAKEAKALMSEFVQWGPERERGPMWENITAVALLQAGADILVMRHPKAVIEIRKTIDLLMQE